MKIIVTVSHAGVGCCYMRLTGFENSFQIINKLNAELNITGHIQPDVTCLPLNSALSDYAVAFVTLCN
jgi:hypothetical protein